MSRPPASPSSRGVAGGGGPECIWVTIFGADLFSIGQVTLFAIGFSFWVRSKVLVPGCVLNPRFDTVTGRDGAQRQIQLHLFMGDMFQPLCKYDFGRKTLH